MKIGSSTDPFKPAGGPRLVTRGGATAGEATSASSPNTSGLSELSRKLSAMETNISDGSMDLGRVTAIKSAIRNGEFRVNADIVADRLLQSVQDLLSKPK